MLDNTFPVTFGQQGLWFIDELEPGTNAYNDGEVFRLSGRLDVDVLSAAVAELVARHQVLRTRFAVVDGEPVQVVDEQWRGRVRLVEDRDMTAQDFAEEVLARPFDLVEGPLFRVEVLRLADEDHVLVIGVHHIVSDGWSISVLLDELSQLYNGLSLTPLPVQYTDYARWQREALTGENLAQQLKYWTDQVAGAPVVVESLCARRPGIESAVSRMVEFRLSAADTAALRELSRGAGTTLFMTLLAVFEVLLSRVSSERDLLVGVPVAGRAVPEVEGLVGYFVNMLPLRADLRDDPSFTDLLSRVRAVAMSGFAHQDLPFEHLVEAVNPDRKVGVHPLFQVIFQLLEDRFTAELDMRGLTATNFQVLNRSTPFALDLDIHRDGDALLGRLFFDQAVFDVEFAHRLVHGFVSLVSQVLRDNNTRVTEFALPAETVLTAPADSIEAVEFVAPVFAAPRPGVEQVVAGVMADVLGLPELGRFDDFFKLGGHSLPAVKVISRIRELFGAPVSVRTLFEHPTVAQFSALLSSAGKPGLKPIAPVTSDGPVPMSFAQQRLWFVQELDAASTAYNMGEVFRLSGRLDVDVLSAAVEELVARHQVLRTRFAVVDGVPVQVVDERWRGQVRVVEDPAVVDREFAEEVMARPFDLVEGPLFRVELLRLAPDDHVLALTMHHIVCDGWSLAVMLDEITRLYNGLSLAPLPVQYTDFAVWQRDQLQGDALDQHLKYWTDHLSGAPTLLNAVLPKKAIGQRVGVEGFVEFELSAEVTAGLRELSRGAGTTLFMTLLAVFEVLLSRVSGERDLLVGVPVAGRAVPEVEGLVGFFVNMLALRADLREDPSFTDLLSRVREVALGGFAHQDLPFEHLVEAVNPARVAGVQPLVQVAFQVFEDPSTTDSRFGDVHAVPVLDTPGVLNADLPLAMDLYRDGDGFRGLMTFSESVFSAGDAAGLVKSFGVLVSEVLRDSGRRVSELPLLAAADVPAVVDAGSGGVLPVLESSLIEVFWQQVARTPDAVAVVDADGSWSFAELGRAVDGVAASVAGCGEFIAVAGKRSRLIVAGLLGVMQAGAAVVPLELADPINRVRAVVEAGSIGTVLCDDVGSNTLAPLGLRRIELEQAVQSSGETVRPALRGRDLAFVVFTSGSTGAPKGVLLEHGAMVNLLRAHQQTHFGDGGSLRVALSASVAFDAAWDQLLWLVAGHELHVVDQHTRRDSEGLLGFVREHEIDVLDVPQSQMSQLLDLGMLEGADHRPSVLVMGGEAVRPALWQRFADFPDVRAWNFYGPTECTIDALTWRLADSETPLIGRSVANTQVRIVDSAGNLVPLGVVGEICLAGAHVARGYLDLPRLTADRFVPDPFGAVPGGRMYRTGDLGRFTEDGVVEFFGRSDQQVKVRGYRVELGEVESAIAAHPDVREVVVTFRDGELIAHLVAEDGVQTVPADLRSFASSRLPDYMLPRVFIQLDLLPRLASGKIDVSALPTADDAEAADFIAPRSGPEQVVAIVMAGVLGLPRMGRFDDFFKLGGHSLTAGKVISRVRELFGAAVSVRSLFEHPTVTEFAAAVSSSAKLALKPIHPAVLDGPPPASFAQQRLWFVQELDSASTAYNMGEAFRLSGRFDVDVLSAAVEELVARHQVLRTRFAVVDDAPVQIVDEQWRGQVQVIDNPDAVVTEFVEEVMARPFDLVEGPLFRVEVLRLATDDHVLAFTMHHIICDGWSVTVMLDEIALCYNAMVSGYPAKQDPLPLQYSDFAVWQREEMQGDSLAQQLKYWTDHVSGAPTLLETLSPQTRTDAVGSTTLEFELSAEVTVGLRELSRGAGTTLFMTLLAVFEVLLSRVSGERDLLVGVPVAGRAVPEVECLVGFFVNMLALRADLRDDPCFADLLSRVREVALGGFAHQDLPFEHLVEAINPERVMGVQPLVQATFQLFEEPADGTFDLRGLDVSALDTSTKATRFDLSLDMFRDGDGLRGWFHCAESVFSVGDAARLVESFGVLVSEVLSDSGRRVSELPLLAAADVPAVVDAGSGGVLPVPESSVIEVFWRQVEKTPDAVAVVDAEGSWSFAELGRAVDGVAASVAGCGEFVAVAGKRSRLIIAGLLGVMQAGAAVVPLELADPINRVRAVVEAASVGAVLCDDVGAAALETLGLKRVELEQAVAGPGTVRRVPLRGKDLACLLFTSGPKGVLLEHGAMVNLLRTHVTETGPLKAELTSSLAFDAAWCQLLWLIAGHELHVVDEATPNLYGPTEGTIAALSNGRPVPNTQVRIVDSTGDVVPLGVVGEICLAGVQVARGYLNLPRMTADRFVPDPYTEIPGGRMYRTGDLGRFTEDGVVQFLGRSDQQVQVQGYRVELGEVESTIAAHPDVREARVSLRDGKLFARIVPSEATSSMSPESIVASWKAVYDRTYDASHAVASQFDAWHDSFTDRPIPVPQMQEWIDATVDRIRQLSPRRVLEIGSGAGLLMSPLVEQGQLEHYRATDFSAGAVARLETTASLLAQSVPDTEVVVVQADALTAVAQAGRGYDTVVVNSVAQYFPSTFYLDRVISGAIEVLEPGGHIYLGDLRNAELLEAFAYLKHYLRAGADIAPDELAERVATELRTDGELSVSPNYVTALLDRFRRISAVEISPRRGEFPNEMTLFRYDVVLHIGCAVPASDIDWTSGRSVSARAIERRLTAEERPFGLRGVANARLAEALHLQRNADDIGLDPEALCRLAARYGWFARITWDAADDSGAFDVSFSPEAGHYCIADPVTRTNRGRDRRDTTPRLFPPLVEATRIRELRAALAEQLPTYMIPANLVLVTTISGA